MSRKIVFINQATGYLTIDIINAFVKEYDKVILITGSIRIQDTLLDSRVRIRKVVRYNRGNNLKKAFSWIVATIKIFFLLKYRYKDYEVFFITIPPTAYLMAPMLKSSYSIAVFDLFPDALIVNGFNEHSSIYKWWLKKNRKIFKNARRVFTLSDKMKYRILEYSGDARVSVISNWSAFTGYNPIKKEQNNIIKREKLDDKFIIQYSGNIGATHNVEILVELADLLKHQKDVEFLIIGRGERSNTIHELIAKKGLTNCQLLPFRKDEELYESLCVADIAVVTLDDRTPDISIPSKMYNIFSAGVPIMVIASLDSTISDMVVRHNAGSAFEKEDLKGMVDYITEMKSKPGFHKEISENSLQASDNYTNANALKYLDYYKK